MADQDSDADLKLGSAIPAAKTAKVPDRRNRAGKLGERDKALLRKKAAFRVEHLGMALDRHERYCASRTGNERVSSGVRWGFWWDALTGHRRGSGTWITAVNDAPATRYAPKIVKHLVTPSFDGPRPLTREPSMSTVKRPSAIDMVEKLRIAVGVLTVPPSRRGQFGDQDFLIGREPHVFNKQFLATERRKKSASPKGKKKKPTNKKLAKRFPKARSSVAETLCGNVRRLRMDFKLSQADLAKAIGTDQAAIGLTELSRANPTLLTVEKIAEVLQTTVVDLLTKHRQRRGAGK